MATLTITKTGNGFSIAEKDQTYIFQSYTTDEKGTSVDNEVLSNDAVLIGTSKGIILLTTECSINGNTYNSTADFITALYA